MKMTWKKNPSDTKNQARKRPMAFNPNLPFEDLASNSAADVVREKAALPEEEGGGRKNLSLEFEVQGNRLAEEGKYHEALGKWETAITLAPERAVLHEQKAQVLLELGEAWNALKAATRATELEPAWAEAWITLGRAQLNFGEPDCAVESFDRALSLKPDAVDAKDDRQTALHLVKKRNQLHSTGFSSKGRFTVGEKGFS